MDEEYDSRLAFSYNCIMSVLKKEYPKLKIDKLEASVNKYMAQQNQPNKGQDGTPPGAESRKKE